MPRLIPRDEAFQEIFVKDGENLLVAARALNEMFTDFDRLDERVAEIQALEHAGDEIDAEIAARLERSFITPFDREDIHELSARLDDVVDGIQEAAETVVIYGIDEATDEARQMAGIIGSPGGAAACCAQAPRRISRRRVRTSPWSTTWRTRPTASRAPPLAGSSARAEIRLRVIKLRDLYNVLEETIDAAEDAAEVIERIAAKAQ